MKRFKFFRVRVLGLAAGILLAFCFTAHAQMAVTQYDASGRPITQTNAFWVRLSEDIQINTDIFQAILTQLEKNKYTGNDLRVIFSNSTIGATQSGAWNIGTLTGITNPISLSSLPALTETTRTETSVLLELPTADTEYSYTLPANTVYYYAMEQSRERLVRFSDFSGGTDTGHVYFTARAGEYIDSTDKAGTKVGAKTLYFRDPTNSATNVVIRIVTLP